MSQTASHTIVHLLRHGEVHNPPGVLYGRLPGYHLSTLGVQMADRVAASLADVTLTHLASSPLDRARETIAPIAASRPELEVVLDERLIEAGNAFEGQVFGLHNAALWHPRNWYLLRNPFKPSWGEPYVEVAKRMRAAIADAAEAAGVGGQALLVSHQLPIWVSRLTAEGHRLPHDPRARECRLASLTSFHFRDGHIVRVIYSEPARDLLRRSRMAGGSTISAGT